MPLFHGHSFNTSSNKCAFPFWHLVYWLPGNVKAHVWVLSLNRGLLFVGGDDDYDDVKQQQWSSGTAEWKHVEESHIQLLVAGFKARLAPFWPTQPTWNTRQRPRRWEHDTRWRRQRSSWCIMERSLRQCFYWLQWSESNSEHPKTTLIIKGLYGWRDTDMYHCKPNQRCQVCDQSSSKKAKCVFALLGLGVLVPVAVPLLPTAPECSRIKAALK